MTAPLHILTLSTLFPNAAQPNFGIFVERQTAELASRAETDIKVINPIGMPPWPLSHLPEYRDLNRLPGHESWNGLNLHRPRFTLIPKIGGATNPRRIFEAILPLVKQLHSEQPFDLIDAEFFYPDGPTAQRLAAALNIPFTIKARGADIHYWGREKACKEQILDAANSAAGLLAVSGALKQDMTAIGMAEDKIKIHYTGLDQSKFKPVARAEAKRDMDVNGPLFICTGALIARKNQDLVIEAIAAFPDATLLLAGDGPDRSRLEALAARLGLSERVRFAGNVPHDELPRLTAAADIAILVSRSEGLANAWVEALSCGTPIIISEAGGARELVGSDSAGRIADQSAAAITAAIRDILSNPPAQQIVRDHVAHFSWQNNGDQLIRFFRNIVENS